MGDPPHARGGDPRMVVLTGLTLEDAPHPRGSPAQSSSRRRGQRGAPHPRGSPEHRLAGNQRAGTRPTAWGSPLGKHPGIRTARGRPTRVGVAPRKPRTKQAV